MSNTSPSKGNQTEKFSLLMEYDNRHIFFQISYRKLAGRLVPDFFLFF